MSVQYELLRVTLATSSALEGPMNTVRNPQMRDQPGDEVELLLAHLAGLGDALESVSMRNNTRPRNGSFSLRQPNRAV